MAEAHDTRGESAAERDAEFFPLNDLPNDVLVSVFAAINDQTWVRRTFPLVCKGWAELYRSKDASPLHETLELNFEEEVERAEQARHYPTEAAGMDWVPTAVHGSRIIPWAQRRAGSVRKLRLVMNEEISERGDLEDFSSGDLGTLVYVVAPSLTEIKVTFYGRGGIDRYEWYEKQFWKSLRDYVVPAGRLRSLVVGGIASDVYECDFGPLRQLAGSLEELVLHSAGLQRFPESFFALTELRRLVLVGHPQIEAIPAGISSLKKLEDLDLRRCRISSLPKELGELSKLRNLNLSYMKIGGATGPAAEALPAELGKLKSLRILNLGGWNLRTVPAFVGKLKSLQILDLSDNDNLQIDAPLDFLVAGCPRLRVVRLGKAGSGLPWTPESRAHLEAFDAKLRAKNPNAQVSY